MKQPFPWQETIWSDLTSRAVSDKLPHALLFSGAAGLGKAILADALVQSLLCRSPLPDGKACGQCNGCHLLSAGTHPDLRLIEPEEAGKAIPVDAIRGVGQFFALKSQYGRRQIVIIRPAEAMKRHAANSLLKTLEEPTDGALLILITSHPSLLLPTIRSRCQQVVFRRPENHCAKVWLAEQLGESAEIDTLLALNGGAPLAARAMHEEGDLALRGQLARDWINVAKGQADPVSTASQWADLGLNKALFWLSGWVMDLIRLKSGAGSVAMTNVDLYPQWREVVDSFELRRLFVFLEQLTETIRVMRGQINTQLAMEDLMICWSRQHR